MPVVISEILQCEWVAQCSRHDNTRRHICAAGKSNHFHFHIMNMSMKERNTSIHFYWRTTQEERAKKIKLKAFPSLKEGKYFMSVLWNSYSTQNTLDRLVPCITNSMSCHWRFAVTLSGTSVWPCSLCDSSAPRDQRSCRHGDAVFSSCWRGKLLMMR